MCSEILFTGEYQSSVMKYKQQSDRHTVGREKAIPNEIINGGSTSISAWRQYCFSHGQTLLGLWEYVFLYCKKQNKTDFQSRDGGWVSLSLCMHTLFQAWTYFFKWPFYKCNKITIFPYFGYRAVDGVLIGTILKSKFNFPPCCTLQKENFS